MRNLLITIIVLMFATPAFALDGAITLYTTDVTQSGDNTFTGSNIFNSGLTSEDEILMGDNPITDVGYIDFNLDNGIPQVEGRMVWNDDDGVPNIGLKGGTVNGQVFLEMLVRGKNTTSSAIGNGVAVWINGGSGSFPTFGFSNALDLPNSRSVGIATEIIADNGFGYATTFGLVRELDTSSWSAGDILWLAGDGALSNTIPTDSRRKLVIGHVIRSNANEGIIMVHTNSHPYFAELSGPALTQGSVLFIDAFANTTEDNSNFFWDDTNDELIVADFASEAEMYSEELTITLTAGVWANITGLTNGPVSANGMVQNGTDGSITVTNGGRYKSILGASIENNEAPPAEEYHMSYKVNGSVIDKCEQHRSVAVQSALGSITVPCMLDLPNGAVVIPIANSVGGDDLTIEHLNWMLFK